MKRQISILACLLMLLAVVFAVASCTQPEAAHVHTYVESVTKEATCTDKGEVTLTCACGDKYTNETAAKGHNLVTLEAVEPTCVAAGLTEGQQCADCGLVTIAQVTVAAKGHKLGAAATCTTAQTCEYGCGQVFVEALGHNAPAATCTEDSVCKRCGELQEAALGHDPIGEPTCTEPAICNRCEEVALEALGHKYPADCYEGYCQRCWSNDSYVEGNGEHEYNYPCDIMCIKCEEWVNWGAEHKLVHVEAKESTCTVNGNNEYWYCEYCTTCWNTENTNTPITNVPSETLPLAEHEYFYECDRVCMNCNELTNPEAEHSIIHVEAKAPTCTVYGNIEYWYCEYCGSAWSDAELTLTTNMMSIRVPETGHAYFTACDPVCMNCYELTNPEATHTITHVEAVAPTCTEMGNSEYWQCTDCGLCWDNAELTGFQFPVSRTIIGALGHKYAVKCDPVCQVCFDINTEAAHDIVHEEAKAPNCTENGNIENWYCSYCNLCWIDEDLTVNTNRNSVVIPNLGGHKGHDYDRKCDVCNLYVLPEEGEAFKLGMYQANKKDTYYITGSLSGYYLATTTNPYSSPDVFLEEADGGFYLYFMSGTTKKYISVQASGSYNNPKVGNTKGLFTLDEKTGAIITKTSNGTVYLGTYGTYTTVGASYISYITGSNAANVDKTQHLLRIEILIPHDCDGSAATCTAAGSACSVCGNKEAALGHTTDNGLCERCGETIVAAKYAKVTSSADFTSGTYVIVVSGKALGNYSSNWVLSATPTISGDMVTNDAGAVWTLTVSGSSVTIKDAAGNFIKPKSGNNNGIQTGSYNWAWTWNSDGTVTFAGTGSDTTKLALNVQEGKFRAYKNGTISGYPSSYPCNFTVYKLVTE